MLDKTAKNRVCLALAKAAAIFSKEDNFTHAFQRGGQKTARTRVGHFVINYGEAARSALTAPAAAGIRNTSRVWPLGATLAAPDLLVPSKVAVTV